MRIFLTGLPGSGKTFLGKLWAEANALSFYDLDALIEEDERMPVEKIFAEKGREYFREREAAVLRNTDRVDNCIIACGGGTPCFFDNMNWMNRNGVSVFLDDTHESIFYHLLRDKKQRPLVPKDPRFIRNFITKLAAERKPFYDQCTVILSREYLNSSGFDHILKLTEHA